MLHTDGEMLCGEGGSAQEIQEPHSDIAAPCLDTEVARDFTRKGHGRGGHSERSRGENPQASGKGARACPSSPRPEKRPLLTGPYESRASVSWGSADK